MEEYNMIKAINASEVSKDSLSEEVINYLSRVVDISLMDDQFWDDFILGASLWGITAGYTGAL